MSKSKARKLAEFLRNLNDNSKLDTTGFADNRFVTSRTSLENDKTSDNTFVTNKAVTEYVDNAIEDFVVDTTDFTLTFDGHMTGTATVTDFGDTTISLAAHSSLGTDDITEHADYPYFTNARARGAISVDGDLAYNSSTGVLSFTERTDAEVRGLVSAGGSLSYNSSTGVISYTQPTNISTFTNDSSYITNSTASLDANKITSGTFDSARIPTPANGDWWNNGYVRVQTDGVMEVGKYLDFHTADSGGGTDFDVRVTASSGAIDIDGDLTVDAITASGAVTWSGGSSTNANTAYGWGNHASQGYITNSTASLNADKITAGTLATARLPRLLNFGSIADLDSAWTSSGSSISGGLEIWRYSSSASNIPVSYDNANGLLNWFTHPSGGTASYGKQIATANNSAIYFRNVSNGSFGSWQRFFADNYHPNADKWTTARTLTLNGAVSGSASWDGSANVTLTTTVTTLADLALTGTPTAPTASAGTNTTQIATTAFVTTAVDNIVDAAPGTLDTLNELAAALGDDANFSTTVTNSIATKLPLAGGTMTGTLNMGANAITSTGTISSGAIDSSAHAVFGISTVDPDSYTGKVGGFGNIADGSGWGARGLFVHGGGTGDAAAMAHNGSRLYFGIQDGSTANSMATWLDVQPNKQTTFAAQINTASHGNSSQWNTAYAWGNHASAGYNNASNLSSGTLPSARLSGTYSNALTFSSPSLRLKGHMYFDEYSSGRHYVHFATSNSTNQVDWRIQTNGNNTTVHSWYHTLAHFRTPVKVTGSIDSDINGNNTSGGNIVLGATGNNASKWGSVVMRQYDSGTETEGYSLITGSVASGVNNVVIGGGLDEQNAASVIYFKAASNTSTRNGTEIARINTSGLDIRNNVLRMTGTTVIDASRNITAGTISSGNITSGAITSSGNIYTSSGNIYTSSGSVSATGSIGNLVTGSQGQQMERGDDSVTTLRFDANRWRLYAGANAGEMISAYENGTVVVAGTDSRPITIGVAGSINTKGNTGGWAMGLNFVGSSGTNHGGFGGLGGADNFSYYYIGAAYNNSSNFRFYKSGQLNIGTTTILDSSRVLQNVTANASIINAGTFPLARMPANLASIASTSTDSGLYFRGTTEKISGEVYALAFYAYNANDGFLFLNRDGSNNAKAVFHIGGYNNATSAGYSSEDTVITISRNDGAKAENLATGLSASSYRSQIVKTTTATVFSDTQGKHEFDGNLEITEGKLIVKSSSNGFARIEGTDANHMIIMRGNRDSTSTGTDMTTYYQYGGTRANGKGHLFYTGGALASQSLKLGIHDDAVVSHQPFHITGGNIHSDNTIQLLTIGSAAQNLRTKSVFAGTSYGDTPPAGSFNATNTYELNGTTVIDSSRNIFPYQIRGSGGDDTPAGTQFSNVIKAQGTNRTIYFDGDSASVSTWYGVGNNPYAAIDCVDGVLDVWVNDNTNTWRNIADFANGGLNITYGGFKISGSTRIDSSGNFFVADQIKIGDDAFIEDFNIANAVRIKGVQNSGIGYIAFGGQTATLGSNGDSALRYNGYVIANTNGTVNGQAGLLVGGTTVFDASRRIQNASIDPYIGITEGSIQGNGLNPSELMHYSPGDANVLADTKNFNVFAFKAPTMYRKASGTWSSNGTFPDLTDGRAAYAWGSNIIARSHDEYIFYFGNDLGYCFMSSFTFMHSTNGNSMTIYIETAPSGTSPTAAPTTGGWVTEINSGSVGSWPGSTTIKKNVNVGGSYRPLFRVRIVPNFSHASNAISWGQMIAKAGYGPVTRLFDWDGSRNVTFYNKVTADGGQIVAGTSNGGSLRVYDAGQGVSNTTRGLFHDGNYTNGYYRHRWRKQDNGGGVPLYLDKSGGSSAYTTIARFGTYSGNPQEFEVYGQARITSNLEIGVANTTTTGYLQLHGSTANKTAELHCTNGNLHIDAETGHGIYMNWYGGTTGTYFGNGASGQVASITGSGNFTANGSVTAASLSCTGNLTVSSGNATGGGIILADDGDIVDLNDAYCSMRFSYGVRVYSGNRSGSVRHTLHSNGSFTATGNITAYSDIRLKENITPITNAVEKVNQINGVTYNRTDLDDSKKRFAGVIAQEVEQVLPEVVDTDDQGIKNVAYGNMVGLLIEAIKEQSAQINAQQEQINQLTNMVNALKEKS